MSRTILMILALVMLPVVIGCGDAQDDSMEAAVREVAKQNNIPDRPAPPKVHDLTLPGLDGAEVRFADFAGEVVLVDFWATWCPPCRHVMPSLEEIHNELSASGVRIVAVSTDEKGAAVVAPFIEKMGYTFTTALATPEAFKVFGQVSSIPTSFLVRADGTIAEKLVGAHPKASYLAAIKRARS